jgi:hypothetical protein
LALRLEPSRALRAWWWALHALLAAAAWLVGWPWPVALLALAGVIVHGLGRRPGPPPETLLVAADGACRVPQWGEEVVAPGPRTRLTWFAIDLDLGVGPRRRRLTLLADQLEPEQWTRLQAILRRVSVK